MPEYPGCCGKYVLCFRSVGIFVQSDVPWELRLVRDTVVSIDNFAETPEFVRFFHVLAGHVLDPTDGGHVDLFLPLGSCGLLLFTVMSSKYVSYNFQLISFYLYILFSHSSSSLSMVWRRCS